MGTRPARPRGAACAQPRPAPPPIRKIIPGNKFSTRHSLPKFHKAQNRFGDSFNSIRGFDSILRAEQHAAVVTYGQLLLACDVNMGNIMSKRKMLFELAAGMNLLGLLVFNKAYTNDEIPRLAPTVFSAESQLCIQLWGAAYLAAASTEGFPGTTRALSGVFCAEKLFYVWTWFRWLRGSTAFAPTDGVLTRLFFYTYGLWDLICALFIFAPAAMCSTRERDGPCKARKDAR